MVKSKRTVRKGKDASKSKLTKPTHAEISHFLEHNPYLTRRSTEPRTKFWDDFQQNLYTQIYSKKKVFHHRHVDWVGAESRADMGLKSRYEELGILSFCSKLDQWTWEIPLIQQFYATLFVDPRHERIDFMIEYEQHSLTKAEIAEALEIRRFTGTKLHLSKVSDASSLYDVPDFSPKHDSGFKKDVGIIERINTYTILPKLGNRGSLPDIALSLIYHIYEGVRFDVADFLLGVMRATTLQTSKSLPYAPFIMQILRRTGIMSASYRGLCTTIVYKPLRTHVQQGQHEKEILAAVKSLRTLMENKIDKVDSHLNTLEFYKTPIMPSSPLPMQEDEHQQGQILPAIRSLRAWVEEKFNDMDSRLGRLVEEKFNDVDSRPGGLVEEKFNDVDSQLGGLKRRYADGARIVSYQRKRLRSNLSQAHSAPTNVNSSDRQIT